MAKTKMATPAHRAVGRVVRALTYPIISDELDLTLRELNALATLAHVNQEVGVTAKPTPKYWVVDSFDAMQVMPGCGQSFWEEQQFIDATDRLAALGLATITQTLGKRLLLQAEGPGRIVRLTKRGEQVCNNMALNLDNSLSVLDDPAVRDDLELLADA